LRAAWLPAAVMQAAAAAGDPGATPITFPGRQSVTKSALLIHGTAVDLVALKSDGLPLKSQRSTPSPVRLRSVPVSMTPHGCAPNKTNNRVQLPTFKQLRVPLDAGDRVRRRQRESVSHVVVAARVLTLRMIAVHG